MSAPTYNGPNGQTITILNNIFRLLETIGRGSYGTVHKAVNLSSSANVAIKVISKEKLRKQHERRSIEKEIETMRVAVEQYENGHPHIVRLLCTKESQHHIFIVLEYCAGGDISSCIKESGGLSEAQARVYMAQLAAGLQFLRSQNVIHRDLKPANLLLTTANFSTAKLKIADFGFARELQNESLAESVVGSPLYMAPELLEYKSYDAKADLWSVGIILYEMIANDHPFLVVNNCHATNHLALRRNIHHYFLQNGKVLLPSNIDCSEDCADLIQALLRPDPRERISFEDFFNAKFLLPFPPTSNDSLELEEFSSASPKRPLIYAAKDDSSDWVIDSAEYVIVEREYEEVGREVLDEQDLSTDFDSSPKKQEDTVMSIIEPATEFVAPVVQAEVKVSQAAIPPSPVTVWRDDQTRLEEMLGLCYKRFDVGSVALFVPTPRGDYIAFHEGCPHYYLAGESIQAAKKDGRNPPYVLGCIVFTEDYTTTKNNNPYHLRIGTVFHIATVSALSDRELVPSDAEIVVSDCITDPELSAAPLVSGDGTPRQVDTQSHRRESSDLHQRISFRSFQISDLALFFQKSGKNQYLAFHEGCPNYYLAEECIDIAKKSTGSYPAYICGEIIFIDSFQATEDFNPYRLTYGTRFYVVTVDVLKKR